MDRIGSQLSCFLRSPRNSLIKITDFDIATDGDDNVPTGVSSLNRSKTFLITSLTDLALHTRNLQDAPLRIISSCSPNSILPLALTRGMFERMMSAYHIDSTVIDTMLCLGARARTSETGMGNLVYRMNQDGTRELHYRLLYVEHVVTSNGDSWAIRQTIIIQKSWPNAKRNLFIFFHPRDDCVLEDDIQQRILDGRDQLMNWCGVHLMILSWYLPEWRHYMRHLGVLLDKATDFALTFDMSQTSGIGEDPSRLQQLHYLHDEIICMTAWLKTSTDILHKLDILYSQWTTNEVEKGDTWNSNATQLSQHIQRLEAYTNSASLMKDRVLSTLRLLEVGIQQDNHRLASSLNRGMLGLAEATAADDVTVKTVTFVTLVFLPANLVAAVLGTNFFSSADPGNNLSISPNFWIFFAISIPLTILTIGGWKLYSRAHERRRRTPHKSRDLDSHC